MAQIESFEIEANQPIDIVEQLATRHEWDFDRICDEQIAMAVEGQWRTYSLTFAWSDFDEILRLICSFDISPPEEKLPGLYELLNSVNDGCWAGAFSYWPEHQLMVHRYDLILSGESEVTPDQIDIMIKAAVMSSERYCPAFQLLLWGEDSTPTQALQVAIAEAYGRA